MQAIRKTWIIYLMILLSQESFSALFQLLYPESPFSRFMIFKVINRSARRILVWVKRIFLFDLLHRYIRYLQCKHTFFMRYSYFSWRFNKITGHSMIFQRFWVQFTTRFLWPQKPDGCTRFAARQWPTSSPWSREPVRILSSMPQGMECEDSWFQNVWIA